jgi:hypothetical protein
MVPTKELLMSTATASVAGSWGHGRSEQEHSSHAEQGNPQRHVSASNAWAARNTSTNAHEWPQKRGDVPPSGQGHLGTPKCP